MPVQAQLSGFLFACSWASHSVPTPETQGEESLFAQGIHREHGLGSLSGQEAYSHEHSWQSQMPKAVPGQWSSQGSEALYCARLSWQDSRTTAGIRD